MIREHDSVVLTVDLPEHRLKKGDVGTVVLLHGSAGFEVEFMTLSGETLTVVSLSRDQVRRVGSREIAQARAL
jgi:putative heme iron utilization protein